ncbi:MAG TPA: endonuclease MutS2 [Acidobacteriota bacterium]|nr:endonuclease MutS2 [Acidobacteriota bacterium]
MDQETRQLLNFDAAIALLEQFAHTQAGRTRLASLEPLQDFQRLEARLKRQQEGLRFVSDNSRISFAHLEDPRPLLDKLGERGSVLEPGEFLDLAEILKAGQHLRKSFSKDDWPLLAEWTRPVESPHGLIEEIGRTFDPNGEVREQAHPQLAKVRRQALKSRKEVQKHLERLLKKKSDSVIQDAYVTNRNGRFVIPVKTERQSSLPGVVHGASSSGATVFVEPMSAVDLNNSFIYYQEREQELIRQILAGLSDRLREEIENLRLLADLIARVDALMAACQYAEKYRCVLPAFEQEGRLDLHQARHPLLISSLGGDQVVPIDIRLSRQENGMVISGPNTGGKTVALKTVGLLALMAQCGLPVPAENAVFPHFRAVLADIGDHQSIAQHLSTFSAHVLRIRSMMEALREDSRRPTLILLDEIGTGTDPVHGAAMAIAVIDHFRKRPALVLATTHHQSVKVFAAGQQGLVNACVELDPKTQAPTYRIRYGLSGGSSGLEVARRLGLSEDIIDQARGLMKETDRQAEQYLQHLRRELEESRRAKEEAQAHSDRMKQAKSELEERHSRQLAAQQKEFEQSLEKWAREFKRQGGRYLKSLKDRFESAKARRELEQKQAALKEAFRRQVRHQRGKEEEEESQRSSGLREGDWVSHQLFGKKGKVLEVGNGEARVDFEGKRMTCPVDQLRAAEDQPEKKRKLPKNVSLRASPAQVSPELNLIGQRVDEAVSEADKYLDQAALSEMREVRIIHGHGTGRLKKAVAEFLQGHPHVRSYKSEGGATKVRLRD